MTITKSIPVERLQEMATRGLIIHPAQPDFLTCDHRLKRDIASAGPMLRYWKHTSMRGTKGFMMNGGARTLVSAWQRRRRSVQISTRPHLAYGPIPCFCIPRRCLWIPWRCLGNPRRCLAQLLLHPHRPLRAERPPSPQQLPAPITRVMYSIFCPNTHAVFGIF